MSNVVSISARSNQRPDWPSHSNVFAFVRKCLVRKIISTFFLMTISINFFSNLRFAMDVIGTVGFGLDVNTLDDPNHKFREIEKQVNAGELLNRIRLIGSFFCPK